MKSLAKLVLWLMWDRKKSGFNKRRNQFYDDYTSKGRFAREEADAAAELKTHSIGTRTTSCYVGRTIWQCESVFLLHCKPVFPWAIGNHLCLFLMTHPVFWLMEEFLAQMGHIIVQKKVLLLIASFADLSNEPFPNVPSK